MAIGIAVESLERLAQEVLEVVRQVSLMAPRGRRRPGDLKEGEFLTLAMLQDQGTKTVGEIQRELGVLPAQMSRIVRSLENRDRPMVVCKLNPQDKRKIDVTLTEDGVKALSVYSRSRVARILEALREMNEEEQEALAAILEKSREILRR